jgi:hypothetical protein
MSQFANYLPDGAKETMLRERIQQLAAEGLANEIAKTEAEIRGDQEQAATFANNIEIITSVLAATEAQLPTE